jgi:hypothetical protein
VERWILQQNIMRFQRLLAERTEEPAQCMLRSLLLTAQRDLAFLEAESVGVGTGSSRSGPNQGQFTPDPQIVNLFQMGFANSAHPSLAIDAGPGLHILAMNEAYAQATMTAHASVVGRPLFEIFPDNPGDPLADGVSNLYASLRTARETGQPHAMQIQHYDVRAPDGQFVERYWRPLNTPMFNDEGYLMFLLHQVEDVTSKMLLPVSSGAGASPA